MADMKVSITADNTKQAKEELQQKIRVALEAVGIQASSAAKEELQKSPKRIDTGLLRNSITHALDGGSAAIGSYKGSNASAYNGKWPEPGNYQGTTEKEANGAAVYIGTNVNYAIYVHEGTDKMAPNRFLKNAVENNKEQLIQIIKDQLGAK